MLVNNINKEKSTVLIQKLNQSPETYAKNRVNQIRRKINSNFKERNVKPDKQNYIDNKKNLNTTLNGKSITADDEEMKFQFSLSSLHQIKSIEMSKITSSLTSRQNFSISQLSQLQKKSSEVSIASRNDQQVTTSRKDRIKVLNQINSRIKMALNQRCLSKYTNINLSVNKKQPQTQVKKLLQSQPKRQEKRPNTKELLRQKYENKQNIDLKIQKFEKFENVFLLSQEEKNIKHCTQQGQERRGKYLRTIKKNMDNKTQEKIKEEILQKRIVKQTAHFKDQALKKSPIKIQSKVKEQKSNKKQISSHRRQASNFKISENLTQLKEKVEKKQTLKLAHILSIQVQKQTVLKEKRWKFMNLTTQNKWEKLRKLIPSKSLQILKSQIQIPANEHDPFFETVKHTDQNCIQDLVETSKQAIQNWNRYVKHSIKQEILERQSFNIKDIDHNSKGFLSVQDLVCFVNLYTGQYFRNRDLISLMRRFTEFGQKQLKISYNQFMKTVCNSSN